MNKSAFLLVFLLTLATGVQASADEQDTGTAPEDWNLHLQSTFIDQYKRGFRAAYTGPVSLSPQAEKSHTLTFTAALGRRLWQGGEIYLDPEVAQGHAFSRLTGMGGFYNGEITRVGSNPTFYMVRMFVRQTLNLGGGEVFLPSGMNQLAGTVDRNRIVLTVGFLPPLDIFDGNAYAHDPRTQFFNWGNMTHTAFDYAADARGNTWGGVIEWYQGDWVFRYGHFMQPKLANQLPLDTAIFRHYGQDFEIEHAHELGGQPGKVRLLAFRNTAFMGGYADALAGWATSGRVGVPDTGKAMRERVKYGIGLNIEQAITPEIGLFARAMWQDGGSDTYAFAEVHRSIAIGASVNGALWQRDRDTFGVSLMANAISGAYQQYLAAGGLGFFIGDGRLNYRPEQIAETYYSLYVANKTWLSLDYQYMRNPAYNADRGPLSVLGMRLHWEY